MPSLKQVVLPQAFLHRRELKYKSSGSVLECFVDIGALIHHRCLYPSNPKATVHSSTELSAFSASVESIIVDNNACNEQGIPLLDLSRFPNLRVFEVGSYSFSYVEEVKLIGLHQLERVVIGKNSFTKRKDGCGYNPQRHFYLKNCEGLKELKMGCYSFSDYSVCEIENVESLEVIEMGELKEDSCSFTYASLELKSDSH